MANNPRLPIQLMRYRPVKQRGRRPQPSGFELEESWLGSLRLLAVDGPWPNEEGPDQVKARLPEALFDSRQHLLNDRHDEGPAAIAHFACHCNTSGLPSENYELVFMNVNGERSPVTLGEIFGAYGRLGERASADPPPRAAVIVNACGSSTVDPLSALSFQHRFLRNKHPSYLGTQAAIPDVVAAKFSEFLYRFLLGGFTLGESVLLARRELLTAGKSPLGLLYVLHGNDQLSVEVKHEELLPPLFPL